MNRVRTLLVVLVVCVPMSVAVGQSTRFRVATSLNLTTALNGFSGRVELLEDSRLTPDLDKMLWGSGGPDMAFDPSDSRYKELTVPPLKDAVVRLIDQHSKTVQEMTLERSQARLETQLLHPGIRTILITTDLSAGIGSYSGPSTELVDVSGGRLDVVKARDARSEALAPIYLADTPKTAWKIVAGPEGSKGPKDILELACRPNADASAFYVIYTRYRWSGAQWVVFTRREPGMWEADEPFPPPQTFPGR